MLEPWRKGIVTRLEDVTPQTRRFWIQVPELEVIDFRPGQFVTLDLPIHEKRNKRWRSYSIASAPDGTNTIELVIVHLEGGLGTQYLFEQIQPGSELSLRGPQGSFTLPDNIDYDLYLVCTGTGIAPFRSMVRYIHAHKLPHRDIHLIFGCRTLADGLYVDEMRQLEKDEPGFYFHPCYSREQDVPEQAYRGYVHQVYEQLAANTQQPSRFYLCGWKMMIDDARQRLEKMGFEKQHVHYELYG